MLLCGLVYLLGLDPEDRPRGYKTFHAKPN